MFMRHAAKNGAYSYHYPALLDRHAACRGEQTRPRKPGRFGAEQKGRGGGAVLKREGDI